MSEVDTFSVTGKDGDNTAAQHGSNETDGTVPVVMRLGFKLGQTGTYSTMELAAVFTSHHTPGNMTQRSELYKRDVKMALRVMDELADELNAARGGIGQYGTWTPSGISSSCGGAGGEDHNVMVNTTSPPAPPPSIVPPPAGSFAPPPAAEPPKGWPG